MKKLIIVLVIICLLFAGAIGYFSMGGDIIADTPEDTAPDAETQPAEDAAQAEPVAAKTLDYDALYASHDPDAVVMTVGGKDVKWSEYYSLLYGNAQQLETAAAYYGIADVWNESVSENSSETFAVMPVTNAEGTLQQFASIETVAEQNQVTLDADAEAAMAADKQAAIVSVCGEDGTEEDFRAALDGMHMSEEAYDRQIRVGQLYKAGFAKLYGADGANVPDEDAIKFLEDGGYIYASHILLTTMDMSTGEALDEAAAAEKKATADKLYAELAAIEDTAALVKRFAELKSEYCEDTGKTAYPDGYVFAPGSFVAEFEDAAKAMGDYGLSEPVLSSYGYHIILRLPPDPDAVMQYTDAGVAQTARSLCAESEYNATLEATMANMTIVYADGFTAPNLLDYVK